MRRLVASESGPMALVVDVMAGEVEVIAEEREFAEVALEPVEAGDSVAEDLIERAACSTTAGELRVRLPRPDSNVSGAMSFSGGSVTVFSGNVTIVNGRAAGDARVVSTGGGVRIVARVPQGSAVEAETVSADVRTRGGQLRSVDARSVSGDLDLEQAGTGQAGNAVRAKTTSGDLTVRRLAGRASVRTVSGDVRLHAVADVEVEARAVSGDVRVTSDNGRSVQARAKSVSGDVSVSQS